MQLWNPFSSHQHDLFISVYVHERQVSIYTECAPIFNPSHMAITYISVPEVHPWYLFKHPKHSSGILLLFFTMTVSMACWQDSSSYNKNLTLLGWALIKKSQQCWPPQFCVAQNSRGIGQPCCKKGNTALWNFWINTPQAQKIKTVLWENYKSHKPPFAMDTGRKQLIAP